MSSNAKPNVPNSYLLALPIAEPPSSYTFQANSSHTSFKEAYDYTRTTFRLLQCELVSVQKQRGLEAPKGQLSSWCCLRDCSFFSLSFREGSAGFHQAFGIIAEDFEIRKYISRNSSRCSSGFIRGFQGRMLFDSNAW